MELIDSRLSVNFAATCVMDIATCHGKKPLKYKLFYTTVRQTITWSFNGVKNSSLLKNPCDCCATGVDASPSDSASLLTFSMRKQFQDNKLSLEKLKIT